MAKTRFITVGLGPVGRTLTAALKEAKYQPVLIVGRGHKVEQSLARRIRSRALTNFPKHIENIDFILLTLPTSKLAGYVKEFAAKPFLWQKMVIIHASGSLGSEILAPLAKLGAGVAAMHPYQTFPKRQSRVNLQGITFGITGNRRGAALARRLASDLGARAVTIREKDRMLYHLSAILACTFVAADIEMATMVLKSLGISEQRALATALPIAAETIRNIKELGIRAAMTGPQTRGDKALIRRHLNELKERLPELAKTYSTTSRFILDQRTGPLKTKRSSH